MAARQPLWSIPCNVRCVPDRARLPAHEAAGALCNKTSDYQIADATTMLAPELILVAKETSAGETDDIAGFTPEKKTLDKKT